MSVCVRERTSECGSERTGGIETRAFTTTTQGKCTYAFAVPVQRAPEVRRREHHSGSCGSEEDEEEKDNGGKESTAPSWT